jgi:LCP family protein required for cell wall assembly
MNSSTAKASAAPTRHPWLAALLSAIIPGTGQLYGGDRRRAVPMLVVDAFLILFALLAAMNELEVAKAWVRPGAISFMMLANIALLAYRLWASYDAYHLVHDQTPSALAQAGLVVAGVVLAAILFVPHTAFGYFSLVQYDLITDLFVDTDVAAADSTPNEVNGVAAVSNEPVERRAIWDGLDRVNILLVGADSGVGRRNLRTDTMIVVSLDPETGDAAMFTLPRNLHSAPLPEGYGVWDCNCFPEILNEIYHAGIEHAEAFPGPGTPSENAMKGAISEVLGIPVHYYALVTLDGFVGIVDALGGVEIYVPDQIVDEEYPHEDGVTIENVVIEPGLQKMDGHESLAYARIRRHASDYARMNRQRCVLEAVLEQSNPAELLLAYPRIADVLKDALQTDIPLSRLPDFIDLLPLIDTEEIITLKIIPSNGYLDGFSEDGQNIYNIELIHQHVELVLESPEIAIAQLDLEDLDNTCGEEAPPEETTTTTDGSAGTEAGGDT